jgi:hypothetical protein
MSDTILTTNNYYTRFDPQNYYRTSSGTTLAKQTIRAKDHKDVYLSDLLNNPKCSVSFNLYRDTNDKAAPVKTSDDVKQGIVVSYTPETNLVAIDSVKKRPSRLSTLFKRTNKMRYVEPSHMTVSSVSMNCLLRRVGTPRARASPKGATPRPKGATPRASASPKGATPRPKGATPRASASPKGGKKRTRKHMWGGGRRVLIHG